MKQYTDVFGVKYGVGAYISYAATRGNGACLRIGRVVELTDKKYSWGAKYKRVVCVSTDIACGPYVVTSSIEEFDRVMLIDSSMMKPHFKKALDIAFEKYNARKKGKKK